MCGTKVKTIQQLLKISLHLLQKVVNSLWKGQIVKSQGFSAYLYCPPAVKDNISANECDYVQMKPHLHMSCTLLTNGFFTTQINFLKREEYCRGKDSNHIIINKIYSKSPLIRY
jgi:hypothetical protein